MDHSSNYSFPLVLVSYFDVLVSLDFPARCCADAIGSKVLLLIATMRTLRCTSNRGKARIRSALFLPPMSSALSALMRTTTTRHCTKVTGTIRKVVAYLSVLLYSESGEPLSLAWLGSRLQLQMSVESPPLAGTMRNFRCISTTALRYSEYGYRLGLAAMGRLSASQILVNVPKSSGQLEFRCMSDGGTSLSAPFSVIGSGAQVRLEVSGCTDFAGTLKVFIAYLTTDASLSGAFVLEPCFFLGRVLL